MARRRRRGCAQVSPSWAAALLASRICLTCDGGSTTAPFSGEVFDCTLPCTGTKDRACQLIHHLSAWNEALIQGLYELRERPRTRTELALASVDPHTTLDALETLLNVATLLWMLVRKHHCVTAVELVVGRLEVYDALFCDALRGNEHIQSLRLVDFTEDPDAYPTFLSVIPSLKNLKHFEYSTCGDLDWEHLKVLEKTLVKTSALESLHIPDVSISEVYTIDLLTAITVQTYLRELSLNFSFFKQASIEVCNSFAEHLKNSDTLATLSLHGDCDFCSTNGKVILRGLRESKSIVKLEWGVVYFDDVSIELMASLFDQNTVLRCLHVRHDSEFFVPEGGCFDSWLRSLEKNNTIEEMTLPVQIWRPQQWLQIIGALSAKENVKSITITWRKMHVSPLNEFRQNGLDEKVILGPDFDLTEYWNKFSPMKSKAFLEIKSICLGNEILPRKLAVETCALIHVTSLTLTVFVDKSHMDPLSAIADLIEATTKLKTLDLSLYTTFGPANSGHIRWAATIKSLSRNQSISRLRIVSNADMQEAEVELLADVIRSSESITRLCIGFRSGWLLEIFKKHLSRGIAGNYSLVGVDFAHYFDQNAFCMPNTARRNIDQNAFCILNTARRNFGLVSRASQFLFTAEPERLIVCAAERVFRHRALLQEFADVECTTVQKAAAALRAPLRAFDDIHSFMRMTGVVRSSVECHARRDERPQLDDLNEPCWWELRRYLFLDYVVTQVPPTC